MESQPKNPEFRINPENFHPCYVSMLTTTEVRPEFFLLVDLRELFFRI